MADLPLPTNLPPLTNDLYCLYWYVKYFLVVWNQSVGSQPFSAEGATKEDLLVPQTYFGWSSEDVDMQARAKEEKDKRDI